MTDTVRVFDFATKKVTTIPTCELAPGMVSMKIEGMEGEYFVDAGAAQLVKGEIIHPPFSEEVRDYFRSFAATFADVHPMTVEEWEDGFRRDLHADREIALWRVMEDYYKHFTEGRWLSVEQKTDIFKVILACSLNGPDYVVQTTNPRTLSRKRVKQIADYCRGSNHREKTQPYFMADEQRTPVPKTKGGTTMDFSKLSRNPFGGDDWADDLARELGEHRTAVLATAGDAIRANRRMAMEQGIENPVVLVLDVSDAGGRDVHQIVDPRAPQKYGPQQQVITLACHPRRAAAALMINSQRTAEMIVTPPPGGRDTWVALVSEGKTKLMAMKLPEEA
jgi:hypothetical protein